MSEPIIATRVDHYWKVEAATCQKCGARPATETWSEGSIAFVHGMYQRWCKPCVLTAQLEHMRKMVPLIPAMEAELARLLAADGPSTPDVELDDRSRADDTQGPQRS